MIHDNNPIVKELRKANKKQDRSMSNTIYILSAVWLITVTIAYGLGTLY